ncbi:MAG: PEP-CTERM sorting domain-containing protein [Leptolyngbyaceae cyanobacterium SM1_1_3]|nr:PEP-CTERM sorting domain-containing protein [Leptolyngbyaceae cyanobacterium SM1_1_3]NJN03007.1 PEP-CTERM sorting domain-containing protein [Leptolyngbyaceae cyanobacterium RM1_1_2]NJO08362.1 PEP-CTERM sorting domain-containing protein [Leptolyngbyaceae cyanobacterium SL_1_1]
MLFSKKLTVLIVGTALVATSGATAASAAIISFDELVEGQTSFGFDGDSDGVDDVIFSTTDPLGYRTVGPGLNQNFVNEPGLEGTSILNPDLRVDFLNGASGSIQFGFALNSFFEGPETFTDFKLFDSANGLIATQQVPGIFSTTSLGISDFPEGEIFVSFPGVAAYGEFDFSSDFGRFIIDNFEGTFGSTETVTPVPEPVGSLGLIALAGLAVGFERFSRNKAGNYLSSPPGSKQR